MLDLIGAIAVTATYATLVGVLVALSPISGRTKLAVYGAAAAWGTMIVSAAALGGFATAAFGPVPPPAVAFVGLLGLLLGGWAFLPGFRRALLSVPLPALIAVNIFRTVGILFLILAAEGRLSAPFAPSAGWGDIATGVLALPLAVLAAGSASRHLTSLTLWNAFGVLDLVAAIALGLLSAPGTPFRLFTEMPGTAAMAALPWTVVPTILVPLYLLVHLTIAAKLRTVQPASQALSLAG